jgi:hypothetical protein
MRIDAIDPCASIGAAVMSIVSPAHGALTTQAIIDPDALQVVPDGHWSVELQGSAHRA